jgi:hypothetical protein
MRTLWRANVAPGCKEREMTKKSWFEAMGIGVLMFGLGCSEATAPTAPSNSAMNGLELGSESTTSVTDTRPIVTLRADLTADPPYVTVRQGYKVGMANRSDRYVTIRGSNCSQFNMMNLPPGGYLNSSVFQTVGMVCNYYAWDVNWSRKIFEGKVEVVP